MDAKEYFKRLDNKLAGYEKGDSNTASDRDGHKHVINKAGEAKDKEYFKKFDIKLGAHKKGDNTAVGGRVGYKHPIDKDSELEVGVSGHYAKGKNYKDVGIDGGDITYKKRLDNKHELEVGAGAGKEGVDRVNATYTIPFRKGGRIDGIAKRGKTKGRIR